SEEHTSELQSLTNLVCRLLLEKKKKRGMGEQGNKLKVSTRFVLVLHSSTPTNGRDGPQKSCLPLRSTRDRFAKPCRNLLRLLSRRATDQPIYQQPSLSRAAAALTLRSLHLNTLSTLHLRSVVLNCSIFYITFCVTPLFFFF